MHTLYQISNYREIKEEIIFLDVLAVRLSKKSYVVILYIVMLLKSLFFRGVLTMYTHTIEQLRSDLETQLTELSEVTKHSNNYALLKELNQGLAEIIEDYLDSYEAQQSYDAFLMSEDASIPLSEVEKKLALAD